MMAGDTDAAEAYRKTAANFRPRNLQIIAALRLSEVFNDFEGPVSISEREADIFGWQTDLGGMALRAEFAQVSGENVNTNTYEEIANSIVKVTAAAKLGVARVYP